MLADRALEWKDEYIHRGMLIGKKEGISIGRNEGISLGETKGVKSVLQALLQSRFGVLPQDVAASIAGITDVGALQRLTLEVYRVESFPAFRALLAKTVKAKEPL